MKFITVIVSILFLLVSSLVLANGKYAKAWPRQVEVLTPDPVLGDKPYWEHWVYSKKFAKRFTNFDVKNAEPELNNEIQAIVLRVNMTDFRRGSIAGYPEQYSCELEIYFNSSLKLQHRQASKPMERLSLPENVLPSYKRLKPIKLEEQNTINAISIVKYRSRIKHSVSMFSNPTDGRYKRFSTMEYHPNFLPGLSVIVVNGGSRCQVTAPLAKNGSHWISLRGKIPYGDDGFLEYKLGDGSYMPNLKKTNFDESPYSKRKGFNKVPKSFSKILLPKAALIKAMNICLYNEGLRKLRADKIDWSNLEVMSKINERNSRCDDIRKNGVLTDPYLYRDRSKGLNYDTY